MAAAVRCGHPDMPRSAGRAELPTLRMSAWDHPTRGRNRVQVLLSMQRALWEQVTPNLRGVAVALHSGADVQDVEARFLYDGPVGEVERECTSLAETHCIADMPSDVPVTFHAVERAARDLLPGEEWVYLRRESDD